MILMDEYCVRKNRRYGIYEHLMLIIENNTYKYNINDQVKHFFSNNIHFDLLETYLT